jgi:hypothetical protein
MESLVQKQSGLGVPRRIVQEEIERSRDGNGMGSFAGVNFNSQRTFRM